MAQIIHAKKNLNSYKCNKQIMKNEKEITAETHDFNVENHLQQREIKTTGASPLKLHYIGKCLQTLRVIL
jgi:hypothetical protein